MKVVHFECGLGNQMTCYANYLLVKHYNPEDKLYIENLVYIIDRNNKGINQWNGFELETIFGLKFDNVLSLAPDTNALLSDMKKEYIANEGHYNSLSACNALNNNGIKLEMIGYSYNDIAVGKGLKGRVKKRIGEFLTGSSKTALGYWIKRKTYEQIRKHRNHSPTNIFIRRDGDILYPLSFDVMKNIDLLSPIETQIRKDFTFPELIDENNRKMARTILSANSVSIHARRSDFLQYNADCYRFGYFRKAVSHIRKHVQDPVFIIFSEDSKWCRENLPTLGLDGERDIVYFVDWNSGDDSFRDLQLMSMCKHNVITKSSFGWWASYLNPNPDKIIISQVSEYYSKVYF